MECSKWNVCSVRNEMTSLSMRLLCSLKAYVCSLEVKEAWVKDTKLKVKIEPAFASLRAAM